MPTSVILFQPLSVMRTVVTPARIDIEEPIQVIKGEKKQVDFTYFAGDPFGDRFGLEWYPSEKDAWLSRNRLTEHLPLHRLWPAAPFPSVEEEDLEGIAEFYVPPDWPREDVYGKIFIPQVGQTQWMPVGNPKRQDIGTIQSPRRQHRPAWEVK